MVNISNYYLDLKKLDVLEEQKTIRIFDLYKDMIFSFEEKRNIIGESFFQTLLKSGYLIDIRGEKINEILDDKGIDT